MRDERVTSRMADAGHDRGLAQAAHDPRGHRTKHRGAALAVRLEQTAKRIEVVAGHDSALSGKLMDELTVTVIDHVKDVEVLAVAEEPQRITDQPVDEAVEI